MKILVFFFALLLSPKSNLKDSDISKQISELQLKYEQEDSYNFQIKDFLDQKIVLFSKGRTHDALEEEFQKSITSGTYGWRQV